MKYTAYDLVNMANYALCHKGTYEWNVILNHLALRFHISLRDVEHRIMRIARGGF